jgi:uncharacterized protein YbaR (Trm112 family)/SAM-dependent methyltransferase
MKAFLLPHLICPACLPKELPLELSKQRCAGDDIISGELVCHNCRKRFPIADGIACLLPDPGSSAGGGQLRYDDSEMVNRYLWSHYADLLGDQEVAVANRAWAGLLLEWGESSCDAGCAVGRLTFEMALRCDWAVGFDLSLNFIRAARRLAREKRCTFSLPLEGNLRELFQLTLPVDWRCDNLDFIQADALAVPFASGTFQQGSSLNLLDRVNYPLAHLYEMNRLLRKNSATFLFADPFSWSAAAAPEERWLGGTISGEYAGRGIDNVRQLLQGRNRVLNPPWQVTRDGSISWLMRSHSNHRELISSAYLLARR